MQGHQVTGRCGQDAGSTIRFTAPEAAGVGFEPTNDLDGHCRFSRSDLRAEKNRPVDCRGACGKPRCDARLTCRGRPAVAVQTEAPSDGVALGAAERWSVMTTVVDSGATSLPAATNKPGDLGEDGADVSQKTENNARVPATRGQARPLECAHRDARLAPYPDGIAAPKAGAWGGHLCRAC
jgi:hypothetical protein